jgi:uncharacterized protein (TIGR02597 family)
VGFVKLAILGADSGSPVTTLVSPSFVQPDVWSGSVATVEGTQVTVASASWTPAAFVGAYYAEIASGEFAGAWTDIAANAAASLTTSDDLTDLVSPGDTLDIRKFVTLQDFLGADNRAGLHAAATRDAADEVRVYNGPVPQVYWFYDGSAGGAAEWRNAAGLSAGTVIVPPGQGLAITRKTPGALTVISSGTVKRGPTYVAVQKANNVVDALSPLGLKLGQSNLVTDDPSTGVQSGNSPATADEVVLYPASQPKVYWHYDGSQGGAAGWYDTSYQPADNIEIPGASSFVINRKNGVSFFWIKPAVIP